MKKDRISPFDGVLNRAWAFCASPSVTFVLLGLIIVASVVGAVVPEDLQHRVFHGWWFTGILFAFSLNLTACCIDRIFGNGKKIASTVTHSAVLVILAGSLISYCFAARGMIGLEEGESADVFVTDNGEVRPLGFSLHLDHFSLEWYDASQGPFDVWIKLSDTGVKTKQKLGLGQKFQVPGSGYSVTVREYKPDFMLNEAHEAVSRSSDPLNPAILVRIESGLGSEDRWVFAKHPEFGRIQDGNCKVLFMHEPQVRQYRSRVTVSDPSAPKSFSREISVNHPLRNKGVTLYQTGYDEQRPGWTNLEAVRDPGAGVVFAGFILLNIGLIGMFLPKLFPRKKG